MLAGVDSVGIGINPIEGWNSWMILFFIGVIVVGVSLFQRFLASKSGGASPRSSNQQRIDEQQTLTLAQKLTHNLSNHVFRSVVVEENARAGEV